MTETIIVNRQTLNVFDYLSGFLAWRYGPHEYQRLRAIRRVLGNSEVTLEALRHELLRAEELIARADLPRESIGLFSGEHTDDWLWLTYDLELDIIPIYSDGVALTTTGLIARPSEIPNIVQLIISVPGNTSNGLDVEDHRFGYHFHFGNISGSKLHRTDLLLTFNPADHDANGDPKPNIALYSEKHGSGRYKSINEQTIGDNRRRPIYAVCHSEMVRKGVKTFLRPSLKSKVFFQR